MSVQAVEKVKSLKVADVMKTTLDSIDGSATVAEVVRLMRKLHVSCLLVNRRDHDDAWGIVVRKDVVNKVIDPGKDPDEVRVFEIMTRPLIMVSPGLALKYCARLMHQAGIRRAPVFDGKNIVGIITNTDIFLALDVGREVPSVRPKW
jgi:CBS domain-containing protein